MKLLLKATAMAALLGIVTACDDESPKEKLAEIERLYDQRNAIIETIEDDEIRKKLHNFSWLFESIETTQIENEIPPIHTEYSTGFFGNPDDYAGPMDMVNTFIGGTIVYSDEFHPLAFRRPLYLPFEHSLAWQSLKLENGEEMEIINGDSSNTLERNVILGRENGKTAPERQVMYITNGVVNGSTDLEFYKNGIELSEEETPKVASVKGIFSMPELGEKSQIEFDASSLNKTKDLGEYRAKVTRLDGHIATISIQRIDGEPLDLSIVNSFEVRASDTTGEFLSTRSDYSLPSDDVGSYVHELDQVLENLQKDQSDTAAYETLMRKVDNEDSYDKLFLSSAYKGQIDKLYLIQTPLTGNTYTQEIERDVLDFTREFEDINTNPFPMDVNVYDSSIQEVLDREITELTANEIATDVSVSFKQSDYDNIHRIKFYYPDVRSYLTIGYRRFVHNQNQDYSDETTEVTFFDADSNILPLDESIEDAISWQSGEVRLNFEAFETRPVRASGVIYVRRSLGIEQIEYALDQLPNGVTIHGNQLIIDKDVYESDADNLSAHGPDKKALMYFHDQSRNQLEVRYYYGNILSIETIAGQGTELVPYHFDIEIPPLIDDDKAPSDS